MHTSPVQPRHIIRHALAFLAAAATLLVCDMLWLGVVAKSYYAAQLGDLLASEVYAPAAAAFYILYISALHFFAVLPSSTLKTSAWRGAALGAVVYGSYELTNLSMVRGWPGQLVFVDWAWGVVLTAVAAMAGSIVWRRVGRG